MALIRRCRIDGHQGRLHFGSLVQAELGALLADLPGFRLTIFRSILFRLLHIARHQPIWGLHFWQIYPRMISVIYQQEN